MPSFMVRLCRLDKGRHFIECISFDELFWQNMLSSLKEFFRGALLPALVLRRVQRGLQLDGSDMPSLLEAMEVDDLEDS